jgi:hypothetical protein
MADSQRRLILGNGEQYIKAITKPLSGRSPEPPRTYEQARELVKSNVSSALKEFRDLPPEKRIEDEAVFCMRLHPDATAKSYDPAVVFERVPELRSVGSRTYREKTAKVAMTERIEKRLEKKLDEIEGRLVFVQSTPQGFERLLEQLDVPERQLKASFRDEIRRIERFDTLTAAEQILGFASDWREGRVELVLHPTRASAELQLEFVSRLLKAAGVEIERSRVCQYPLGPTFISCRMNRHALEALAGANPLRAAHPLTFTGVTDLRSAPTSAAPKPPASSTRSTIKIGMFDGGVDAQNALLQGHVEEDESLAIGTPRDATCVAHGTAVAGALLHGPLNSIMASTRLPAPPVYVVSIQAVPMSDPNDWDLFEAIDVIERAVPARSDIKVFNVSFGPQGPIQEDTISRFTYVLDTLAVAHKVTFFVAVGNDGDVIGKDRIQAPSVLVHGLGVGAYTLDGGDQVHASYSCKGPGRECGKIKPDVAAFGGCDHSPIHLVSMTPGMKQLFWGTSFASPVAARLGGQAAAAFERSSTLLARALLVHTAVHPDKEPDHLLGHGCVLPSIDDVLLCEDQTVTVAFQGDILPTKMVRLPIPWPSGIEIPGKLQITWTVAALTPVDPNHPSDYTSCCLEETFYPHSQLYFFSPKKDETGNAKRLHLVHDTTEIKKLTAKGWKQSSFPVSESGNAYKDEHERRLDCKWEPIVRRHTSKFAKNIHEPFLTLHAIGRNQASERFEYVALVTLRASKFEGDLYAEIRKQYPALAPIRLRTEAEIRVQI